ncbi:trans-2-enoyl-CoA reductase family protein [Serpentinicella sp. ANB-PHB4]|uniref:enoyl-ACP reductase FabV n=1 Tax=Serpentinicella sp. ANB-PHB4 TaxID=3074076 RepID=UPI00285714D1|nr:enoyl-ACP reductase FabV [Serpentinicella sp. ANB-PHB4]MDR5658518.1 trans-2-enoyl-CoA reductase family protein [Serpentinicella sp. ANB-PHB4]
MIIEPKLNGNVARAAHPYGCKAAIEEQINYTKEKGTYSGPKKALILGASSSYGLASRISLAFGAGADTIGVSYEHGIQDEKKLATAGWWNNIFFKEAAEKEGLVAKNFIGDAFSDEMREEVIKYIKEEFGGKIDVLIYSLASGRRTDPKTGQTHYSALKPIGEPIEGYSVNLEKRELFEQKVEPATEEEIADTVKVMGGEDWEIWVQWLLEAGVLAEGFKTTLYSYIGPEVTQEFYRSGTLGEAKRDTEETADKLHETLKEKVNGEAVICVGKAVTTKASAVIPIFPVYVSALYKVMLEKGLHEDTMEHVHRFMKDMFYGDNPEVDERGRLRPDSWEMREDVQKEVEDILSEVTPENFQNITAVEVFRDEFMQLNGFNFENVDYTKPVDLEKLKALQP